MIKRLAIKIIVIIVVVIFIFSTGFWLGINFYSVKEFATQTNTNSIFEVKSDITQNKEAQNSFSLKPLEEAINLLNQRALNQVSKNQLMVYAIEGIIGSLDDKYAEYFTEEEYAQIIESFSGTMSGIGVVVTLDDQERVLIVKVIEGTPADGAGLKKEDIITEVEGDPIQGLSLEKVVSKIKGEEGTSVNITVFRPSEDKTFKLDITRQRFYVPNLFAEMLDGNIGYIQYIGFQERGSEKLEEEIENLIEDGAEGIIFDLRNNLGGVLDDAVNVSDLFLNEGTIVIVKGRAGEELKVSEYTAKKGGFTEIPLVVLINQYSASASELVAGALKENDRAILVGEESFGKGTVQTLKELSNGAGLKFTNSKYFLPSDRSIEEIGIKPDIKVELDSEAEEDLQLERAKEEIKSMISDKDG
ncbi:MAG: S41 family peptidase [Candidatus Humimicrobiaceae bacterium]